MMFAPHSSRLSQEIMADVVAKIEYFQFYKSVFNKDVVVFGDNENSSMLFWNAELVTKISPPSRYTYSSNYPLIPTPPSFNPEQYETYESDLMSFIDEYERQKNYVDLVARVFNFGTREIPRMHLFLMNGDARTSDERRSDPPTDRRLEDVNEANGGRSSVVPRALSDSESTAGGSEGSGAAISTGGRSEISSIDTWMEQIRQRFASWLQRDSDIAMESRSTSKSDSSSIAQGRGENVGGVAGQQLARQGSLMDIEELPRDDPSPTPPDSKRPRRM